MKRMMILVLVLLGINSACVNRSIEYYIRAPRQYDGHECYKQDSQESIIILNLRKSYYYQVRSRLGAQGAVDLQLFGSQFLNGSSQVEVRGLNGFDPDKVYGLWAYSQTGEEPTLFEIKAEQLADKNMYTSLKGHLIINTRGVPKKLSVRLLSEQQGVELHFPCCK